MGADSKESFEKMKTRELINEAFGENETGWNGSQVTRLFLMRSQGPLGLEQMEALLFFWPQSTMPKGRKGKRQVIVICLISSVAISRANQSPRSDI